MTTIKRYRDRRTVDLPDDITWIRWSDGALADIRDCPTGRMDRGHWTRVFPNYDASPNCVCECELEGGAS